MSPRPIDSGGLPCPDCGSPLSPCRCERERALGRRVRGWNTSLKSNVEKPLRTRSLQERAEKNPLRHGAVFLEVRKEPCAGARELPDHQCGLGYAPPSAHHLGRSDLDGLVPACGLFHDEMGEKEREVERRLRKAGRPPLRVLGERNVRTALARLMERGELPPAVMAAARRRGLLTPRPGR